ncbi:MAG: hypothetical protein AAB416_02435 [Patescibacteria group bacterium]
MKFVFLFGYPGTGKKTVGLELEKITGFPLLDNHSVLDVVRKVLPMSHPLSREISGEIRNLLIEGACRAQLPGLITTVSGAGPRSVEIVNNWVRIVESHNGSIFPFELRCSMETILKRIAHPSRKGTTKSTTKVELDDYIARGTLPHLTEYNPPIIDTDQLSPLEAAQKILEMTSQG